MLFRTKIKQLLPAGKHFQLVSLKHTFAKFKQIHYAQNCEDVMVQGLFPKDYKGFYVDVGAHHPYRISNTYLLFKRGWSGINIDANPETIKMFQKARPHDINLNIGVSQSATSLIYHQFSDPAVNTFSSEHAQKFKSKNWIKYLGTTQVQTKPLADILKDHLPTNRNIDVLSVDVEGLDLEVLESSNWNRHRPSVVIVEAHNFDLDKMQENPIVNFLYRQGYKLQFVAGFSLIFKRAK